MNLPIGDLDILGVEACRGSQPHVELAVGDVQEGSEVDDVVVGQLQHVVDEDSQLMVEVLDPDAGVVKVPFLLFALGELNKIRLLRPPGEKKSKKTAKNLEVSWVVVPGDAVDLVRACHTGLHKHGNVSLYACDRVVQVLVGPGVELNGEDVG